MHLTYDIQIVEKEFLSEEIQEQIQAKGDLKAQEEAFKQELDAKLEELKDEEECIIRTAAKFGSILKANALLPYNDAVGDYLDMCIEHEEMKPEEIRNHALLSTMQHIKEDYDCQRNILDKSTSMANGEDIDIPVQVMKLQSDLFQLKHFGKTLRAIFDGISITKSARNKAFRETIAHVPDRYTKKTPHEGLHMSPMELEYTR